MPYSVHVERGVPVHEHTRKQYASGKKHPKQRKKQHSNILYVQKNTGYLAS